MLKMNWKIFGVVSVSLIAVLSVFVCVAKPKMHKAFQMNVIEYIIKINTDGSVSSSKTTTTTVVKEK